VRCARPGRERNQVRSSIPQSHQHGRGTSQGGCGCCAVVVCFASDPYCVVSVNGQQVAQTPHIDRTLSPVWAFATTITVDVRGASLLEFGVWDHDMLSGDDMMGFARVPLRDVAHAGGSLKVRLASVFNKPRTPAERCCFCLLRFPFFLLCCPLTEPRPHAPLWDGALRRVAHREYPCVRCRLCGASPVPRFLFRALARHMSRHNGHAGPSVPHGAWRGRKRVVAGVGRVGSLAPRNQQCRGVHGHVGVDVAPPRVCGSSRHWEAQCVQCTCLVHDKRS